MSDLAIEYAVEMAFLAGKWAGQAELEEHYDNEQYAQCMLESINAKNTSMPSQTVSVGKNVSITLRSKKWRKGVIKSATEYKLKCIEMLCKKRGVKNE